MRRGKGIAAAIVAAVVIASALVAGGPVRAAFPGANGTIVFERGDGNQSEIYSANADGTGLKRLTNNSTPDYFPEVSPDGRSIAYTGRDDKGFQIFVMTLEGQGVVKLTSGSGDNEDPTWSPDGTRIAFTSKRDGDNEIYVINLDGSKLTKVTNNSASDFGAAWSPDGRSIAWASDVDGDNEIFRTDPFEENAVDQLTNNSFNDIGPDWSPTGLVIHGGGGGEQARITFSRFVLDNPQPTPAPAQPAGNWEIFTMVGWDGSSELQVTSNDTDADLNPAYSPDGSEILFDSGHSGGGARQLFTVPRQGGTATQLTTGDVNVGFADWGPAFGGTQVAFEAQTTRSDYDIWVTTPNGATNLTGETTTDEYCPRFAFDGSKLVYFGGNPPDIYTIRPDGSEHFRVVKARSATDAWPTISPDGSKIVFVRWFESRTFGGGCGCYRNLVIINADGTGIQRLLEMPGEDHVDPAWSPDGSKIAFSREAPAGSDQYDLFTIQPNGKGMTRLTNTPGRNEFHPAWSPDGTKITFDNRTGGRIPVHGPPPAGVAREIWVMNANGGGVKKLTDNQQGDILPWFSPDGTQIYFSRYSGTSWDIMVMPAAGGKAVPFRATGKDEHCVTAAQLPG